MLTVIIDWLMVFITTVIGFFGYVGVLLLMTLESCGLPIPSEIIMPFAGFLVSGGELNFWLVVIMGTVGNIVGSLAAYAIGLWGGRPLLEKYGKYILISHRDLDWAERWFDRHGELAVFIGRFVPVIRTYISFPAGLVAMNWQKFTLYTALGSLPWSILFTWLGIKMGDNWSAIREFFHTFDILIIVLLLTAVGLFVWRHLRHR